MPPPQKWLTAVLFNSKILDHPKYSLTGDWVDKLWYRHKLDSGAAIKKNEEALNVLILKNLTVLTLAAHILKKKKKLTVLFS